MMVSNKMNLLIDTIVSINESLKELFFLKAYRLIKIHRNVDIKVIFKFKMQTSN